jgi:tRNA (cmo5U34)-methyltransferase
LCKKMWLDHLHHTDLTGDQLSVIRERMSYDRTTGLQTQLDWLTEAGFEDVDCYYKYYNFAVYAGRKVRGFSNGC